MRKEKNLRRSSPRISFFVRFKGLITDVPSISAVKNVLSGRGSCQTTWCFRFKSCPEMQRLRGSMILLLTLTRLGHVRQLHQLADGLKHPSQSRVLYLWTRKNLFFEYITVPPAVGQSYPLLRRLVSLIPLIRLKLTLI